MKDLAVLGTPEFTLGFRLAGIRKVIDSVDSDKEANIFLNDKQIGVVIIDEETMNSLSEHTKEIVVSSIDPVFVVVSEETRQDELRKLIIQSIGVDLLKEED